MVTRSRTKKLATPQPKAAEAAPPSDPHKSLVFISHDSRDAALAEAFATMLTSVSAGTLKSFRSSDKKGIAGIGFGEEWYTAIMSRLSNATDVVALLTSQSIDRPWILYEAGVAKGKLDTTVLGVALGVPLDRVSTGPFGQFQNCADDEESLTGLVMQLLSRNPEAAPLEEAVKMQVRLFKTKSAELLNDKNTKTTKNLDEDQNSAKLFEEVKAMVREIPDRIQSRFGADDFRNNVGKKFYSRYSMMMDLFVRGEALYEFDADVSWILYLSFLKNDFPWIYEAGMDVYRSSQSRSRLNFEKSVRVFVDLVRITSSHPIMRDMSDKQNYMTIRQLPIITDKMVSRLMQKKSKELGGSSE